MKCCSDVKYLTSDEKKTSAIKTLPPALKNLPEEKNMMMSMTSQVSGLPTRKEKLL